MRRVLASCMVLTTSSVNSSDTPLTTLSPVPSLLPPAAPFSSGRPSTTSPFVFPSPSVGPGWRTFLTALSAALPVRARGMIPWTLPPASRAASETKPISRNRRQTTYVELAIGYAGTVAGLTHHPPDSSAVDERPPRSGYRSTHAPGCDFVHGADAG